MGLTISRLSSVQVFRCGCGCLDDVDIMIVNVFHLPPSPYIEVSFICSLYMYLSFLLVSLWFIRPG